MNNSISTIDLAIRIIRTHIQDKDIQAELFELIHAARAKAIQETVESIVSRANHISSKVNHLIPRDENA